MLKYTETQVTFSEVPDQISLCINLSNCPYRCPDCHSKYLWEDIGMPINSGLLITLIEQNKGISCVCFMGGDSDLKQLYELFNTVLNNYPELKVAWYTGRETIPKDLPNIHYIKTGPYKAEFGPLTNPNTNQTFYMRGVLLKKMDANVNMFYDITDKFWKNENKS